jgi:hypothetical protein
MSSNITSNSEDKLFFDGLCENRPSKIIGIILASILPICACFPAAGIIWFERFGSDLKRIFINKIISSVFWNIIAYFVFSQLPDILFYLCLQFPKQFCFIYLTLRNAMIMQIFLLLDIIAIARYIFIFWLKNPLSFQDDFWSFYINCWVSILR